jgi:hypothetical protein
MGIAPGEGASETLTASGRTPSISQPADFAVCAGIAPENPKGSLRSGQKKRVGAVGARDPDRNYVHDWAVRIARQEVGGSAHALANSVEPISAVHFSVRRSPTT